MTWGRKVNNLQPSSLCRYFRFIHSSSCIIVESDHEDAKIDCEGLIYPYHNHDTRSLARSSLLLPVCRCSCLLKDKEKEEEEEEVNVRP